MCKNITEIRGNYTNFSSYIKSIGTFIPIDKSNPYIKDKNILNYV